MLLVMEMTPDRWSYTGEYLREVFGACDSHLANLMEEGVARGLPDIAVSPDVGRLLMILTSMTRAECAVELGTLGGFSAIWIARGLKPNGRLITVEPVDLHADFAEEQFARAGVAEKVKVRRGFALDVLPKLVAELGPASVDVLFFDAIKTEYPKYFELARPLLRSGGLLIADNVLGAGSWWIDAENNPHRQGADTLNRMVSADPDFEAVAVPLREGVLIAKRL
jgi:predicted O-methyltransferase YrrM